ncbi:hypothetical protein C0992_002429 [Termitomyces sp. T32_za158]|nr:hypothetical protein C0992_002429 [Termitomyces sp. T32_za158]
MSQETSSLASALTSSIVMGNEKVASQRKEDPLPGYGESALPEDKDKVEEALENEAHDWENDPENARNWSWRNKWTAVSIFDDGSWAWRGRVAIRDYEFYDDCFDTEYISTFFRSRSTRPGAIVRDVRQGMGFTHCEPILVGFLARVRI